ncbi:MAG: hypothetical protein SV760_01400 [Halobacteria archaeon]|nr:hypothetical protein [Halobacteria archaeon]
MKDDEGAPFVPDVRSRNRKKPESEEDVKTDAETDGEAIKEDMDALRIETPFVPMIAKRREKRLKDADVDVKETDD